MSSFTRLVGVAGATTILVTALVGPASATIEAKAAVVVVNGIPGAKLDICLNGKEVKSGLRYGGRVSKLLLPAVQLLKVYKKDPRKCRGTKLAQKRLDPTIGDDLTLVVTRKAPKRIAVFDNDGLGVAAPGGFVVIRHASDMGAVAFRMTTYGAVDDKILEPAGNPTFTKGQQLGGATTAGLVVRVEVTRDASHIHLARRSLFEVAVGRRYEVILVGTKKKNAKLVLLDRKVLQGL